MQTWNLARGVVFTDEEYRRIEDALGTADSNSRKSIFLTLLTREPAGLGQSVKRLLAAADGKLREAGNELVAIMAHRKDDPDYQAVYADFARAYPNILRQNLEGRKVSTASLRAAAAFAPQWKTLVDAYLNQEEPE